MTLLFNGTEISAATYNGDNLDEIYFNGVKVFEKVLPPFVHPAVGDPFMGGYYAGLAGSEYSDLGVYLLVVAPKSYESYFMFHDNRNTLVHPPSSLSEGYDRTQWYKNNLNTPAIQYVTSLSINGYSDWFIPTHGEFAAFNEWLTDRSNDDGSNPFSLGNEQHFETAENYTDQPVQRPAYQTTSAGGYPDEMRVSCFFYDPLTINNPPRQVQGRTAELLYQYIVRPARRVYLKDLITDY